MFPNKITFGRIHTQFVSCEQNTQAGVMKLRTGREDRCTRHRRAILPAPRTLLAVRARARSVPAVFSPLPSFHPRRQQNYICILSPDSGRPPALARSHPSRRTSLLAAGLTRVPSFEDGGAVEKLDGVRALAAAAPGGARLRRRRRLSLRHGQLRHGQLHRVAGADPPRLRLARLRVPLLPRLVPGFGHPPHSLHRPQV